MVSVLPCQSHVKGVGAQVVYMSPIRGILDVVVARVCVFLDCSVLNTVIRLALGGIGSWFRDKNR